MNTKKKALVVSAAYTVFFITVFLVGELCNSTWCRIHDDDPLGLIFFIFLPLLPTLLLSLLTYKMRDEVFRAWWDFARWFVPVIIAVTLYIGSIGSEGRYPGANGASLSVYYIYQSQFFISFFLYYIFILISLARITHVYLRSKCQEEALKAKREKLNKIFVWIYGAVISPVGLFIIWVIIARNL